MSCPTCHCIQDGVHMASCTHWQQEFRRATGETALPDPARDQSESIRTMAEDGLLGFSADTGMPGDTVRKRIARLREALATCRRAQQLLKDQLDHLDGVERTYTVVLNAWEKVQL